MHKLFCFIFFIGFALLCITTTRAQTVETGHNLASQDMAEFLNITSPLSPAEQRMESFNFNLHRLALKRLIGQPTYTHTNNKERHQQDTSLHASRAIVYASSSGSKSTGDFLPYQGNGASDYRIGGYGELYLRRYGTMSGRLQYARGRNRNIGWSAMRLPELYLPYISTDSIGGDFKYDRYIAQGRYGFSIGQINLAAELDFEGEQAWRLSDPRALTNTTWLRPAIGAAIKVGDILFAASAGYGRNKQHMRLRYWRPGEQDRFFVAYGFGLYDTRQSGVAFGKSRMYYIDEWRGALAASGTLNSSLTFQAGINFTHHYMTTEESDIYNLYESRTSTFSPHINIKYFPTPQLTADLWIGGKAEWRKGYENIIEEYLIDKQNNIYDFRTLDTQQNYNRDIYSVITALRLTLKLGAWSLGAQGGLRYADYKETYQKDVYSIGVAHCQPHARFELTGSLERNFLFAATQYTWQRVGSHHYDVDMGNPRGTGASSSDIGHLDFQHAFAPYAYRAANTGNISVELRFERKFNRFDAGMQLQGFITHGHRKRSIAYTGTPSFVSTAPMLIISPDIHNERYGTATLYFRF